VYVVDRELDVWLLDLARPTLTPVTSSPGPDSNPLWTPNGQKLIFSSQRAGVLNLFSQAADRTGQAEPLTKSTPNVQLASAISPGRHALIFTETSPTTGEDVMQLTLDEARIVTPLVKTAFSERNGIVSPNGQWLAYEANDSGRFEIFVVPFPEVTGHRETVSTAGGTRPLWGRNGRELFYVSPTGAVMRVGVERGPSWAATPPTVLVKEGYFASTGSPGRSYDYDPRQQQFLMIKESDGDGTAAPASIVVVLNWVEELKRLVPTK
jgi:Tol biopolymer transport system component